jgi:hypothetical protein
MGLGSRWFDVGRPDHLGPLIGFVGDEFAEAGRRQRKHRATEVGDPRLQLRVGEARIDLVIEFVDEFVRRALGAPTPYHALTS